MAVNLPPLGALRPVAGVRLGTASAGIKQKSRDDIALFEFTGGTVAGAVFTRNSFKAAPVLLAQSHLAADGDIRSFVINSGNANAATGELGLGDARTICGWVADHLGVSENTVLPFSTGVIGQRLPLDRIETALPAAIAALRPDGWNACAHAIMTTDTGPKAASLEIELGGGKVVTLTGIAKGAGMICPNMATMLAFVATDAAVARECLQQMVAAAAERSFNRITIDGDTSTNDAFLVAATGAAGNPPITSRNDAGYAPLQDAITALAQDLAQRIVRDGEGATRFVTVHVSGGRDGAECLRVARCIADSPLVKTALFAGDPNWGRFCMAIGRAGVDGLDTDGVTLHLDDVCVAERGMLAPSYREEDGARVLAQPEFGVHVGLGRGNAEETVWTCDFSYEYVRINAEYRT
jgi:glutamate N-acetyltransferase / amino-acid N-acetyltransferase